MIDVEDSAAAYFQKLIEQQGIDGLGIRMRVVHPGTPQGDCKLEFCEPEDVTIDDVAIDQPGFTVYIDRHQLPWLEGASMRYDGDRTGGQLTIRAPKLKGSAPGAEASIVERVQYVLDTEINPGVASHGGQVSLVEISRDGIVVLRFGGGCQGCSQVSVTLKQGVEKSLLRLSGVTAVRDVTDHESGENPYFRA